MSEGWGNFSNMEKDQMLSGAMGRIAELERREALLTEERAALWRFVRVCDVDSDFDPCMCVGESLHYEKARAALVPYEEGAPT